jgi:hypothetical protein
LIIPVKKPIETSIERRGRKRSNSMGKKSKRTEKLKSDSKKKFRSTPGTTKKPF